MPTTAGVLDRPVVAHEAPARPRRPPSRLLTVGLAGLVFWLAYDNGSYSLVSRTSLAILVWWVLGVGFVLRLWPRARPQTAALALAGCLAALVAWTALSMAWASNHQAAFDEIGRTLLYLGVFLLVVVTAPWTGVRAWVNALALALAAVIVLALLSRLFPSLVGQASQYRFLPFGQARLNYPVGYWNGLAILVMLGTPLFLRVAISDSRAAVRAGAVAILPLSLAVVYLASSRGGLATGGIAAIAFLLLARRRLQVLAALAVGCAGSAAAVAILRARSALANDPASAAAASQGHTAAALLLLVTLGTAAAYAAVDRLVRRRRASARTERVVLVAVAVVLLAGVVAAHPVRRFDQFKSLPAASVTTSGDYVGSHLASVSGNGRWQYWTTAFDEFRAHPVLGGGAGSFSEWWTQHEPIASFVLDAHSWYLQTLGELGLPGLAIVLVLVGAAVGLAVTRPLAALGENTTAAALGAVVAAYVVAAGIDWMWELTIVTLVGLIALGLLASPPAIGGGAFAVALPVRVAIAVAAVAAVTVQAIPLLASERLRSSQDAVRRNNASAALAAARGAHDVEPWAYAPYLQIALVDEQLSRLPEARTAIEAGIERDPNNWQLWLVRARLETKSGDIAAARRSLARIRKLNPLGSIGPTPKG